MHKIKQLLLGSYSLIKRHFEVLYTLVVLGFTAVIILCFVAFSLISPYKKYILPANTTQHFATGMVLGAGVNSKGRPYKELQARLDVAADAVLAHKVDKLILSGDNRFEYYDEPTAMRNYLVQVRHIPADKLVADFAGRSTYESCERAAKIFGQHKTVIYSAGSHLPRAIYLCRTFGIDAYGVSSGVEANNSGRRELMARVKALFNVYIRGEKTILGTPIKV